MNIVPNDILGVTKLLRRIISHTTHWSHKNQARYVLKQWKTHEMLQLFHSHVSLVSWLCCIALTNLVSLSEWHMLHLSVAHFTFHKEQHTWNLQHVAMFRIYVSCAISSQRDAWCSCSWNAVQMWKPNTRGVTRVRVREPPNVCVAVPLWCCACAWVVFGFGVSMVWFWASVGFAGCWAIADLVNWVNPK